MTAASGDPAGRPDPGPGIPGEQPPSGAYEAPPIEEMPAYGGTPPGPPPLVDYPADFPAPSSPGYPPPEYATPYLGGYGYPADSRYTDNRYGVPQGTNPLAIFSLVASGAGLLCGLGSVVGILLGAVAINQVKRTGQDGYGLAVAGVVVGVATLVVTLIWMTYVLSQP